MVMGMTISENATNIRDLTSLAQSLHLASLGSNLRNIYSHQISLQLFNTAVIVIIIIIDIAVPNTHNLAKTITDKQNKYQKLANEICGMWKQNTAKMIPIAISSTRVIPKSLPQSLKRLNLHPNTYIQMQKSVILGTCSIVKNFLSYK
jgi:hypothetical protein